MRREIEDASKMQITIASSPIESMDPSSSLLRVDRMTTYLIMTRRY
jgi:hypothetical protein